MNKLTTAIGTGILAAMPMCVDKCEATPTKVASISTESRDRLKNIFPDLHKEQQDFRRTPIIELKDETPPACLSNETLLEYVRKIIEEIRRYMFKGK